MRLYERTGVSVLPLLLGLLLLAASLTPSLIPREWFVQGVLGGLVMALGYLIGVVCIGLWWLLALPRLKQRAAILFNMIAAIPVLGTLVYCLAHAGHWQNDIRQRMGLDLVESTHVLRMLLVALSVFAILLMIGFLARKAFDAVRRRLYRYMPRRTANILGFVLTTLTIVVITRDGILDRVITNLDMSVTLAQNLFDTAPPPPEDPDAIGGAASFVDWDRMGQPGRDYVTGGPSARDIANFTDRASIDPIRVYVGWRKATRQKTAHRLPWMNCTGWADLIAKY